MKIEDKVKKYYIIILFAFMMFMSSCEIPINEPLNVLLINVKSKDCSIAGNFLYSENDTIRVVYVFWAKNGSMGIIIHNKLKIPIYIDWKKCSFIVGTAKNDYWEETETVKSTDQSYFNSYANSDYSIWKNLFYKNTNSSTYGFGSTTTQITKPERITFIPPGATVSISRFFVLGSNDIKMSKSNYFTKDTTIVDLSSESLLKTTLSYIDYDEGNSQYRFRSFLTYSTDEKFSKEAYIDHSFYISRIVKMPVVIFHYARKVGENIIEKDYNMWSSPNSFYVYKNSTDEL
jgi:hypothetical protein